LEGLKVGKLKVESSSEELKVGKLKVEGSNEELKVGKLKVEGSIQSNFRFLHLKVATKTNNKSYNFQHSDH
jgi:hypothetical protein